MAHRHESCLRDGGNILSGIKGRWCLSRSPVVARIRTTTGPVQTQNSPNRGIQRAIGEVACTSRYLPSNTPQITASTKSRRARPGAHEIHKGGDSLLGHLKTICDGIRRVARVFVHPPTELNEFFMRYTTRTFVKIIYFTTAVHISKDVIWLSRLRLSISHGHVVHMSWMSLMRVHVD